MNVPLHALNCIRVKKTDQPATVEEIHQWIKELDDWKIGKVDGTDHLTREFQFDNFIKALQFTNTVGEIAEKQDHHPVLITEWGKVTVKLWTHVIDGLHQNDFILAAKIDQAYKNDSG